MTADTPGPPLDQAPTQRDPHSTLPQAGTYGTTAYGTPGHPGAYAGPYGYVPGPVQGWTGPVPAPPPVTLGAAWSWAWSQLKAAPLVLLVLPVWAGLGVAGVSGLLSVDSISRSPQAPLVVPLLFLLIGIGVTALTSAALRLARGERLRPIHLVTFPHPVHALMAMVVVGLVILSGNIVGLGGLVAGYFFWLTLPVVMDQGRNAFSAIAGSCRLMARHGGSAIAVFVVAWFLQSAGIVTVLGWVVTMPVGCLMAAYTYVRLTGGDTAR